MKPSIVIPSAWILLATVLLLLFWFGRSGDAIAGGPQRPIFAPAPGSPIAFAGLGSVVIGDMNKDGKPDLVVAGGQAGDITVLLGQGDGQFRATPGGKSSAPQSPGEMVLGDVNGDGKLDLAFAQHDSYAVTVLLGDGKGALAMAPNSSIVMRDGQHPHTHGLEMGDLNNDGKLDLVTVNNSDNDISVMFGDGRGKFTRAPGSPFAVGPSPYPFGLGDVNSDGHLDIVATATATGPKRAQQLPFSRALTLLLADRRGGFRPTELPLRTGQPWFVAIGDVNGDRKPDIVATHHNQEELTVLLGDARGGFSETSGSPFNFGHHVYQIGLTDVNRDGKPDVIAAAGNGVSVMLGDGRGGFSAAPQSPFLTGRGAWRFALGDLNGDGKIDVVTGNSGSETISVLLGQ